MNDETLELDADIRTLRTEDKRLREALVLSKAAQALLRSRLAVAERERVAAEAVLVPSASVWLMKGLKAERDALAEVVAAVRELHQPVTDDEEPRGPFCSTCRPLLVPWPCPTVRALAAVDRSTPAPTPETETQR